MSKQPRIELIILGNELLLGSRTNEHLSYLGRELSSFGLGVACNHVIQDDAKEIERIFKDAWKRCNIVITTGGLGPTSNDKTRETVAKLLGKELVHDAEVEAAIHDRLSKTGMPLTEKAIKQCYRPKDFEVLPNRIGTAPGLFYKEGSKVLIMLPGPTVELKNIFERQAIPRLQQEGILYEEKNSLQLRCSGVDESIIEEHLAPLFQEHPEIKVGYFSKQNIVDIRLSPKRPGINLEALEALGERCREKLGNHFVCYGDDSLAKVVLQMLSERGQLIAVAESCTGGLLADAITNVPGASKIFAGGAVCYNNDAKIEMLDVPEALLLQHGSVSAEVALAMATGAAERFYSDYALSTTGFAGPGGGTEENPVGTVYVGFYSPMGAWSRKVQFTGDRPAIKQLAVNAALDWIRRELLEEDRQGIELSIESWMIEELLQ
ncbi:MAG: competence/damage-inducible protein A [Pseudomonadales bacterium]|nr:competence/damage-inducible protein A [Pseudomonadales bacterium]